jgi:hypothetical protein
MCVTPLFYQRLMLHDPSGAAPLRLVLACLTLHDTPMAAPPFARSADKASSATTSKLVAVQPPYPTGELVGCAAARGDVQGKHATAAWGLVLLAELAAAFEISC